MQDENMQRKVSLSVIVPCYNVEPYLDRSLKSLGRQWDGITDYEIILVNDGSPDGTITKLNAFKEKYPDNVVVIDKPQNEGVAAARNSGLEAANGEWVVFFDPDDALKVNSYSRLLDMANEAGVDILSFGVKSVYYTVWTDEMADAEFSGNLDWTGTARDYMLNYHYATSIKFLFKRELLKGHEFPRLTFLEDVVFVMPLFLGDAKTGMTNGEAYFYIVRKSSSTNMTDAALLNKGCDDLHDALKRLCGMVDGQGQDVVNRVWPRLEFYCENLITRLLLCNKKAKEIKQIRQELKAVNLLPLKGKSFREPVYNFMMNHPRGMVAFRPLYRAYRKRKK